LLPVLLCCCQRDSSSSVPQFNGLIWVAAIATDTQTVWAVHSALDTNGITSFIHGSVVYGVFVPPKDTGRAKQILRELAEKRGYYVKFEQDFPK
jgi:hypothetical protein